MYSLPFWRSGCRVLYKEEKIKIVFLPIICVFGQVLFDHGPGVVAWIREGGRAFTF